MPVSKNGRTHGWKLTGQVLELPEVQWAEKESQGLTCGTAGLEDVLRKKRVLVSLCNKTEF